MSTESNPLHILFFPVMGYGHMLPMLDAATLLVARGVKATIITTACNASVFTRLSMQKDQDVDSTPGINVKIIKFPSKEVGLPEGVEEGSLAGTDKETFRSFLEGLRLLEEPLSHAIEELSPNVLVTDLLLTWTWKTASEFGIPRLIFCPWGFFSMCCHRSALSYRPHKKVSEENELFTLPGLPDPVQFNRLQLPDYFTSENTSVFERMVNDGEESEKTSCGMIVNSFYELEKRYADHYREVFGKKVWHIGPVSLCNTSLEDKVKRGKITAPVAEIDRCMKWLELKKPDSVVYACFGSTTKFPDNQLFEIAIGLEASGQDFIWVVSRDEKEEEVDEVEKWLPRGYEKRMKGKGLIIRGWAPQLLILGHEAIGGFMTHCGWNSVTEGLAAGLPMVTWPWCAEQFFNEKLITDVLRIGVGVGVKRWSMWEREFVKSETIEKAVKEVMVGDRSEEMRSKAKKLGELAKRAVKEGGSSCSDLDALVEELKSYQDSRQNKVE